MSVFWFGDFGLLLLGFLFPFENVARTLSFVLYYWNISVMLLSLPLITEDLFKFFVPVLVTSTCLSVCSSSDKSIPSTMLVP